ncbi:spermidine/putrescine transport system substrate-binding protein [Sporobacter termitidis DSM 10068]|uniref:Spermidine/putrescine transport system substrate-binding protein n=1 Tax=Sporobacter termitidis DSM 10068 TaxID=1123282 RepID=A0A1M5X0N7_9FIRM|nr:spermidine/putrescine ABC transporter substrate-binding protein [Sporobacter termitidis]SHH93351.1 spermidine/putrescine transport system substrate-binding protein [Sporobacter termitidis DSM 10068]
MKKAFSFAVAAVMLAALLAGCAAGGGKTSSGEVNVYNWGEYIDESIFADFEKQTGIKVNYTTFSDNESMYAVLKTGGSSYDVIIPSDYMISRLIAENMLEKLDFSNIPNYSQIDDKYKKLDYDPTGEYSAAYMTGIVGLIYNTKMIPDDITSWSGLFDSKYAGKILMFDNSRDALAIALLRLGYAVNTTNADELNAAYDLLRQQKPLVQAYVMDQIFDKLESGEAAIAPYYAGDYVTMKESNPDLKFVAPSEGTNQFVDAMCVPKGAANKKNAELFINFMCSKDVSLKNMEYTSYTSPNKDAADEYAKTLDAETAAVMFPSDDILSRCQIYVNLPQDTLRQYDDLWVKLKS